MSKREQVVLLRAKRSQYSVITYHGPNSEEKYKEGENHSHHNVGIDDIANIGSRHLKWERVVFLD